MNRKSKVIVSIVGITIVLLALLGITYAYYLTRIEGNTNTNSISITTADLKLKYDDNDSYIELNNIMPGMITNGHGDNPKSKTFTVTNDGSSDIEYSIGIDEVTNTLTRTQDLTYSITCEEKIITAADTAYKACETTPSNSGEYPKTNSYLFTNKIKQDYIQKYSVVISYANPDEDQSIDMGSTIKGRMQIYSVPESIDITGTVTGATTGDYVQINSNPKTSVIASDGTYKLIGIEPGTHTLKVMNGSTTKGTKEIVVKQGTDAGINSNTITFTESERVATVNITSISTNLGVNITAIKSGKKLLTDTIMNDNRVIKNAGTYSFNDIADYKVQGDETSGELGMFSAEDDYGTSWYFRGEQSYNYVNFAGMCWRVVRISGDDSIKLILEDKTYECNNSSFTGNWNIGTGNYGYIYGSSIDPDGGLDDSDLSTYTRNIKFLSPSANPERAMIKYFYDFQLSLNAKINDIYNGKDISIFLKSGDWCLKYDNYSRLNVGGNEISNITLKCDNQKINEFSKVSGVSEKNLMYVSALTIDEVIYAGGYYGKKNSNYYLINDYQYCGDLFWTLSHSCYDEENYKDKAFLVGIFGELYDYHVDDSVSFRPSVNIKAGTGISSGDGTQENPYVIE